MKVQATKEVKTMMFDKNNTNYSGEDLCSSCRFKKVFDFEYGKLAVCQKSLAEVKNVGVCCEYERSDN